MEVNWWRLTMAVPGIIVKAINVIVFEAEGVNGVSVDKKKMVHLQDLEINPGALLDLIMIGLPEDESEFFIEGIEGGMKVNGTEYKGSGRGSILGNGRLEFWGG